MGAFLAGLGITVVTFFVFFAGVVAFAGVIAIIRAALNNQLGAFGKIFWILGSFFIPGAAFLYFAFVDRNPFLKMVGWICILTVFLAAITGGTALHAGYEALKNEPIWTQNPVAPKVTPPVENLPEDPEKPESPGDSTQSI